MGSEIEHIPTLPERIANDLLELIHDGSLEAGSRIVEAEIASRFGVSHSPVRDALRILSSEGVVELMPRRGARVVAVNANQINDLAQVISALLETAWHRVAHGPEDGVQMRELLTTGARVLANMCDKQQFDCRGFLEQVKRMTDGVVCASEQFVVLPTLIDRLYSHYRVLGQSILDKSSATSIASAWDVLAKRDPSDSTLSFCPELYFPDSPSIAPGADHSPSRMATLKRSVRFSDYPEVQNFLEGVDNLVFGSHISHEALPEQIAGRIRELIQTGEYGFGDRLKEEELSQRFLTSRGPIREALRVLSDEGLIELRPRRGASVRLLTIEEIAEIYDIRTMMGVLTARIAATTTSPSRQWVRLYDQGLSLMNRLDELKGVPGIVWIELRRAIAKLLYSHANNVVVMEMSREMENRLATHYLSAEDPVRRKLVIRDLRQTKEAILKGDPDTAASRLFQLGDRAKAAALARVSASAVDVR